MTEQLDIFKLEPYEENNKVTNYEIMELEKVGFTYVTPVVSSNKGKSAYRGIFENKGCTIHIDDSHVMIKHDDSKFFDYICELK